MAITFDQALKLIEKTYKSNAVILHREGSADLGGLIARDTPVDTGAATGDWHGSINSPDPSNTGRKDQSFTGNPTKKDIQRELSGLKFKDTAYIQNSIEGENGNGYIVRLESGTLSRQAPNGMVLININNAKSIYDKAYKRNL